MIGTVLLAIAAGVTIIAALLGLALWRPQRRDPGANNGDPNAYLPEHHNIGDWSE